jgi:hypothetical protein
MTPVADSKSTATTARRTSSATSARAFGKSSTIPDGWTKPMPPLAALFDDTTVCVPLARSIAASPRV